LEGPGKDDKDAACVKTKNSISPSCGIYYYEVTIISSGRDGFIGIGLCTKEMTYSCLPGWVEDSFGYHGDDGNCFQKSGKGNKYGPSFATGDVIGCCLNFIDQTCFFTKNGVHLGIAFSNISFDEKRPYFPCVGMRTPGEVVKANFGG
jgi:hypothetical protein